MSAPQISPRIAELLVSHICHDLVSPVGAISNGIEFIEEMGDSVGADALSLISNSCNQASVNLQCFRLAYGGAGSSGNITYGDIQSAFGNYIEGARAKLEWNVTGGASMFPEGYMKVVLNALMLAKETILGDGLIMVENMPDGNGVKITASGAKVEFKDGVEAAFQHTADLDDLTPRSVHAYLTRVFAEFYGVKIDMPTKEPAKIEFTVDF